MWPWSKQRAIAKPKTALSDDEVSDVEPVPTARSSRSRSSTSAPKAEDSDHEDELVATNGADEDDNDMGSDEEDDLDEDEFIVEAIKKHMIDEDGTLKFQVKWEGYDSKKDLTWEPEENLEESAQEILDSYFDRIGGRDQIFEQTQKAAKGKKRGRPSTAPAAGNASKRARKNGAHPSETTPPKTAAKQWAPPAGSWEDDIDTIDACEDEGSGKLVVYLIWKNGKKTKHDTQVVYKKCPQKMLQFYEQHVKIIRDDLKAN